MIHETYKITAIRQENARTRTLIFDRVLPSQPGQFVMAWLPGTGEKPFSIAGDNPFALMVVNVGPVSATLHALSVGDEVWVRGPLGHGYELCGDDLILVGGGYGVAPLLFLAQTAIAQDKRLRICIGARKESDVLLVPQFEAIGAQVFVSTDDGSLGHQGLVTEVVAQQVSSQRPDGVYACGPTPMLEALGHQCRDLSLPHQLSWEAHMRCGVGVCGHCECELAGETPGWMACHDGPVQVVK